MRSLVIGAGPLGSLLAARLFQGGQDVTILSRGQRLSELHQHGIMLKNWSSGHEESVQVKLVESLESDDHYDLVIIVMRKNSALKILPILSRNNSSNFLFLMNNAAGPGELVDALGSERVLMGFMGAAGYREGHKVVYLNADPERPAVIYIGEVGETTTPRLLKITEVLEQGEHIQVKQEAHMDAWLKYHVALLFPAFAPALYLCGNDNYRFARTRDALILAWRGIREGVRVLRTLGIAARPPLINLLMLVPEPAAVWLLGKLNRNPRMEVAMVRHAEVIRDEIQQLNTEFMRLVKASGLFTPTIQFLISQFDAKAHPLPDGSRSIRLDWSGVVIMLLLMVLVVLGLFLIF